ncbi:ArnT family glycosyltransferase [Thermodesulfobium sp.]
MFINIKTLFRENKFPILVSMIIALTVIIYMHITGFYYPKIDLLIESSKNDEVQIFMDKGNGFNEKDSIIKRISQSDMPTRLEFKISNSNKIRMDFGSTGSRIQVLGAKLVNGEVEKNLISGIQHGYLNDANLIDYGNNTLCVQATGNDPFVVLNGDFSGYTGYNIYKIFLKYLIIFILVFTLSCITVLIYRFNRKLFLITLIGILIRWFYFLNSGLPTDFKSLYLFWHDEGTYSNYVFKLLHDGVINYFSSQSSIEVAPGNILYLSVLMKIFNFNIAIIRLFNLVVLSGATIVFTYFIAERHFGSKAAVIASSLVVLYPELIYFAPTILTEPLFFAFFIAFLFLLDQIIQKSAITKIHIFYILICAVVGVMASLTRLVLLPFYLVLLLLAIYMYKINYKLSAFKIIIMISISAILILPFLVNGYIHSGEIMIATGSGAVLWLGSRIDTDGDEPPYHHKTYDAELITKGASHISLEGDRRLRAAGLANIKAHPVNYAFMCVKRIGRLTVGNKYFWFFPYSNFLDWYHHNHTLFGSIVKIFSLFIAISVFVFGIFAAFFFGRNISILHVVLLMPFMIVIYLPFLVNQRYGLPVFLINAILTGGLLSMNKKLAVQKLFLLGLTILIAGFIIAGV